MTNESGHTGSLRYRAGGRNRRYGATPHGYKLPAHNQKMVPLASFDVIFMRANPPLDNLVLNFLDSVKNDVFIINNVEGLREANNKLYTAAFYDPKNEIIPATHVSKNKGYLKKVISESESKK